MEPAERSGTSNEGKGKRKYKDLQIDYEKQLLKSQLKAMKAENKKLRQAFMFALEHLQTNAKTYGVSLSPSPSPSPSPCKKLKKETTNTKNLVKIQADEDDAAAASEPEKFQTGTPDKNDVVGRMASPVAPYKLDGKLRLFTNE
ncbi:hypothetical protein Q3G72_025041 [Acer saccharum]|nr:hypothetical protein Q3G72_025041 [Acer saccharum]